MGATAFDIDGMMGSQKSKSIFICGPTAIEIHTLCHREDRKIVTKAWGVKLRWRNRDSFKEQRIEVGFSQ